MYPVVSINFVGTNAFGLMNFSNWKEKQNKQAFIDFMLVSI